MTLPRLTAGLIVVMLGAGCECAGVVGDVPDGSTPDGGGPDSGQPQQDAGLPDAGMDMDAGQPDAGETDAGMDIDAGEIDAGQPDAGETDAGMDLDGGSTDAGPGDAGPFPVLSINDVTHAEGNAGSTAFTFTVSLDTAPLPGQDVHVNWATQDGTATGGSDYVADAGTLTFTSTDPLSATITVPVTGDVAVEPDEAFTVVLSNPGNATITKSTGTGTITADDFPAVSIADRSAFEGDTGTTDFGFTVTLSAAPPAGYPLALQWMTSDGTAVAPGDYASGSGMLVFMPAGPLTQDIVVKVAGDTTAEPDETFSVTLSNVLNGSFTRSQATGTIRNDELPRASISDAKVKEGDFGRNELVFTVSLDAAPVAGADAQLTWTTSDGTASAGSDYVSSSAMLTFTNAGKLQQRVSVPILGDTQGEPNEQFTVTLNAVANVALTKATGIGTITNDDLPALSINNVTQLEGGAASTTPFVFTVSLSTAPQPGQDVTVTVSTAGLSATSGTDFAAGSATVTFTSGGPLTSNVTVLVNGDATKELEEEFQVLLSNPVNATLADPIGLGVIVDDDGATIRVDGTSTAATPDGLTWATAYPTVQAGVNRAVALGGGQVWVAAGTYTNGGGTGAVLTYSSILSVLGGFDGWRGGMGAQETSVTARDPLAHVTKLDGLTTATHVVLMNMAGGVLDGFTITQGNATSTVSDTDPGGRGGGIDITAAGARISHCLLDANAVKGDGGGIYATSSFVVHDTRFTNNISNSGGAIYSTGAIVMFDSLIQKNSAKQFTLGGGYGGGIEDNSQTTSTRYTNVTFDLNQGTFGAGLHLSRGKSIVRNCTFTNNTGATSGGGLYDDSFGGSQVYDSVFIGNQASNGGALDSRDSNTIISGCRVENNRATSGAGIFNWNVFGAVQNIINTRFAYNVASSSGGGAYNNQTQAVFMNCVFEGNDGASKGGALYNYASTPVLINTAFVNDIATVGPEMQNEPGGSPVIQSVPAMVSSILFHHSFVAAAVNNTGSSSLNASFSVSTDSNGDPGFNHVPLRANRVGSGATTSVIPVSAVTTQFAVNDVVEIGNDGVPRTVTAASVNAITVNPALAAAPALYTHVDNWGPGATDMSTDLRLRSTSVCIDSGNNAAVRPDVADLNHNGNVMEATPLDWQGNPRFADDPSVPDTGMGTAPIVDIGPLERPAP